jgi:glycosyltransferase involved in cell wall biosynthesis
MPTTGKYVLVTPTKDEERTIGCTLASVTSQSIRPAEWVIVSDGSTDRTDSLIREAQAGYPWITLIELPCRNGRCFGAVARATKLATERLSVKDYDYIGLLDSDLRFPSTYFEAVMRRFQENPRLGLAGGRVIDPGESPDSIPDNIHDVPGAVQFFRRECFESLREIHAIPEGGWDMLTCVEARMNGFETALLTDLIVDHLKPRNIAHGGVINRRWQCGVRDYVLGYHPLFETVKCMRRLRQSPMIISAASWWIGYVSAAISRKQRSIPADLLAQIQREQLLRLKSIVRRQKGASPHSRPGSVA